ncbi:MAG: hypothetical protein SGPRY_005499, partial [Prymnesium sp.]
AKGYKYFAKTYETGRNDGGAKRAQSDCLAQAEPRARPVVSPPEGLIMQGVFHAGDFDDASIPRAGLASPSKLRELFCKKPQALIKMTSGEWMVAHSVVGGGRGRPRIRVAASPDAEPEVDGLTGAPWSRKTPGETPNWVCIILGVVGGEFRSGLGTVTVSNATGVRKLVVVGGGGARRAAEVAMQAFLKDFPPTRAEGAEGGQEGEEAQEREGESVEFKELPCSLKILRSVSLLGGANLH